MEVDLIKVSPVGQGAFNKASIRVDGVLTRDFRVAVLEVVTIPTEVSSSSSSSSNGVGSSKVAVVEIVVEVVTTLTVEVSSNKALLLLPSGSSARMTKETHIGGTVKAAHRSGKSLLMLELDASPVLLCPHIPGFDF